MSLLSTGTFQAGHSSFTTAYKGSQVTGECDTVINRCESHGYDEFNRLTSVSGALNQSFSYDRYGNRVGISSSPNGLNFTSSFNISNNQNQQLAYDAAGNVSSDGTYSYTYDAEGNLLRVNGVASYVYDAMNRRVSAPLNGTTEEYLYDAFGHRTSSWLTPSFANEGRIYWDGMQVAFRAYNGQTFFDHQDYLGTERMRTNYQGQKAFQLPTNAFGDGYSPNTMIAWGDTDNSQFAGLDYDSESATNHAQFRQYSPTQGRWMSPDPYDESMRLNNPQTFNRYSYAGNNPFGYADRNGMDPLFSIVVNVFAAGGEIDPIQDVIGGLLIGLDVVADALFGGLFAHPELQASKTPRPDARRCIGATCGRNDPNPDDGNSENAGPGFVHGDPTFCLVQNIAAVNSVSNLHVNTGNVTFTQIYNGGLDVDYSVPAPLSACSALGATLCRS